MKDYKAAAAAYRKGIELDPSNENLKSGLKNSEERIFPEDDEDDEYDEDDEEEDEEGPPPLMPEDQLASSSSTSQPARSDAMPNLPGLGDMFGGGGGMPDLAGMMNNPMMMQMAQQLMANGGLERLMSNPAVANMVRSSSSSFFRMFHVYSPSDGSCSERTNAFDGRTHD